MLLHRLYTTTGCNCHTAFSVRVRTEFSATLSDSYSHVFRLFPVVTVALPRG